MLIQTWCQENDDRNAILSQLLNDVHSPSLYRVWGSMQVIRWSNRYDDLRQTCGRTAAESQKQRHVICGPSAYLLWSFCISAAALLHLSFSILSLVSHMIKIHICCGLSESLSEMSPVKFSPTEHNFCRTSQPSKTPSTAHLRPMRLISTAMFGCRSWIPVSFSSLLEIVLFSGNECFFSAYGEPDVKTELNIRPNKQITPIDKEEYDAYKTAVDFYQVWLGAMTHSLKP